MLRYKKTLLVLAIPVILYTVMIYSCNKHEETDEALAALNLPTTPYNYASQPIPGYFNRGNIDNTPATEPITDWGATLGRILFYDKTLSINSTISCGSCHKQEKGFSDDVALSKGFANELTVRNSMSLINVRYYRRGKFLWDERGATLNTQVLMPIQDHVEMGMNLDTLIARLNNKPYYPVLFQKAFNSKSISSERIASALAQFIRSLVSYRSRFDEGRAQVIEPADPFRTPYLNFTAQENLGKQVFFGSGLCQSCHNFETFTSIGPSNNGLDNQSTDLGLSAVTNLPQHKGMFKFPSLKSVALTAPYMHDGRFATLEEVVEHYNSGVQAPSNLDPRLRNGDGTPRKLNLSADQKSALVAFLKTLTDYDMGRDEKFSDPFK